LERLGGLVETHAGLIQKYYLEFMKGAHKAAVEAALPEVRDGAGAPFTPWSRARFVF
jgi:hypothetical protein